MVRDTIANLTSLLITFKGSTIIFVYAERLKVLLLDFVRIYRDREIMMQTQELKNIQLQLEVPKQLELPKEIPDHPKRKKKNPESSSRAPMMPIIEVEEPKTQKEPKSFLDESSSPRNFT